MLFVPGNNTRMLMKAISPSLECDCIIFDLEDSVPVDQKENARKLVREILKELGKEKKQICLRINQLDSALSKSDIQSFANEDAIENFVVPKAEKKTIRTLFGRTGKKIIPIIETPMGFLHMEEIAQSKGVDALAFGAADMALSMKGSVESYENNDYIRTLLAIVARGYGIDPIDQVFFDLNNPEAFRKEAMKAKNLGYSGKLLIHPSQVRMANEIFSSWSSDQLTWAKRVVDAYQSSLNAGARGAIRLNGQLIDAVHYKLAKDILGQNAG